MPRPDFTLLCQAAVEQGNLFSMLGAGISTASADALPIMLPMQLVARFFWESEEVGQHHIVIIRLEHPDGERLVNIEVGVLPNAAPPDAPLEAFAQRIILPFPVEIRRPATYTLQILVDGDVLQSTPLEVRSRLPTL